MKRLFTIAALLCMASASIAQTAKVLPLLSRDLTDIAGKAGQTRTVEYPPGAPDPAHRHNAHVFVYVLEGSVVMQVKGAAPVTLRAGQTFYEGPNDIHVVGRNASTTKPAKFLAVFIKNKDAPVLVPAQ